MGDCGTPAWQSVTKDPFLFYGTPVVDGYGSMLVVAVGPHCSTWPTPADSASRRAGFTHLQVPPPQGGAPLLSAHLCY